MAPSSTITPLLHLFPPDCIYGCWPLASKCALLGIRCPTDHAIIERTHQTITAQALLGQAYPSHSALWAGLDERRDVLNRHLPSRVLSNTSPLEAYPQVIHSGRSYRPEWEEELLSLEKVCTYLVQGRWFRSIRTNGCFDLGSYRYYLGNHFARHSVAIGFDPMPYRILCNGTKQKSPEARSGLALTPSRFTPLHKIRYGIKWGAWGAP